VKIYIRLILGILFLGHYSSAKMLYAISSLYNALIIFFYGAIILSPRYYEGWKAAGARPPLTSDVTSEFAGQYISINITLNSYDRLGNKFVARRDVSTLPSHLHLSIIHVPKPVPTTSMPASLTPSILSSANFPQTTKSSWEQTSMPTSASLMTYSPVHSNQP
jgi:hypothetical protein